MENPYSPPTVTDALPHVLPRSLWLRIPAFVVLLLGCCGVIVGVISIGILLKIMSMQGFHMSDATLQGVAVLYTGFGVSWMISGWCLRTGRRVFGVLGMVLGILVPLLILGMFFSP
jgi:hypothetical protein